MPIELASLSSSARDAAVTLLLAYDAWIPLVRFRARELLLRSGVTDADGERLRGDAVDAAIDGLVRAGVVGIDPRTHGLRVGAPWIAPLADDAHQRGVLVKLASTLGRQRLVSVAGRLFAALASGDDAARMAAEAAFLQRHRDPAMLVDALGLDAPATWLERLAIALRAKVLNAALAVAFDECVRVGPGVREMALVSANDEARSRIAAVLALEGDAERGRAALADLVETRWTLAAAGFVALTEGRWSDARDIYRRARGKGEPTGGLAAFGLLVAVASDDGSELAEVERRLTKSALEPHGRLGRWLAGFATWRRLGRGDLADGEGRTWLEALVAALVARWSGRKPKNHDELKSLAAYARDVGIGWVADEAQRIANDDGERSLLALCAKKMPWELGLDALVGAGARPESAPAGVVWWTVAADEPRTDERARSGIVITPWLVTKPGTKGTRLATDKLPVDVMLEDRDRAVFEALASDPYRERRRRVLALLVDHPRVRDPKGKPIAITLGEPRIRVETTASGAALRLVPDAYDVDGLALEHAPGRIVVVRRTAATTRIREVIAPEGLVVPRRGMVRMTEALGVLGATVAIDAPSTVIQSTMNGDPRTHVQLFRAGSRIRVRLRVMPAGEGGPSLRPGVPPVEVVANVAGKLVRVTRDLAAEKADAERTFGLSEVLRVLPADGDDRIADDIEALFGLLLDLERANAIVDWVEGRPIGLPKEITLAKLDFHASSGTDWFAPSGSVDVGEDRIVSMEDLLKAVSRAKGRFVRIGEEEWVMLTEEVRRGLGSLKRLTDLGGGKIPLAFVDVLDDLGIDFGADLAAKRDALDRARRMTPEVPADLAGTLRGYQRDGFVFLARRTEVGLAACLADDMGLGKTVQTLALLLHRRNEGPALVLAPTSVCRNWENETHRFAPALTTRRFGEGSRTGCIRGARACDVVIATYGQLVANAELFASATWGTIVFDEAHAMKNMETLRWKAAFGLRAKARVGLTGTPIENHVGELHALFSVLAPGMLGTKKAFDVTYARPIAQSDQDATSDLRRIVRPFLLRRTKNEVLTELPPRTDVLHVVTASDEHRAFYEAARRRAIDNITKAKCQPIEMLKELTRLRRAAIDPRLVGGEAAPKGGKIDALVDMVLELKAAGRRALVFSQFLEVLDFAAARLTESGITHRRLDGKLSAADREAEVAAFQARRADVFLISLKAGGVGMNLTAADVVILLDPWWNPAVEEQAAGRAHRMGQEKPVTVARIVTEATIEEKVLALHDKKRKLYEDVVAGADGLGPIDVKTLAALVAS